MIAVSLSRTEGVGVPALRAAVRRGDIARIALVVAAAELRLGGGDPHPVRFLASGGDDCSPRLEDVLLAGVRAMGEGECTDEARASYVSLLDGGVRVVPWPVLLSREGMPTFQRSLGRLGGPGIGLAVDLPSWLGEPAGADALVGLARNVGRLCGDGRRDLVSLDVWGWSPAVARSAEARALLGRVLASLIGRGQPPPRRARGTA